MEKMLVWMLLWISGVWGQENMKGELFAFQKESSTPHVRLFPKLFGPFVEATVCMRFHSDLTRGYPLFSLATKHKNNDFHLFYYPGSINQLKVWIGNKWESYNLQGNNFTEWSGVCVTWSSTAQEVWVDAKKYNGSRIPVEEISADPVIVIGQVQSYYGGEFCPSQFFVGEITDVNMWDKALTDDNVIDYFAGNEVSGNVINWKALRFYVDNVTIHPYVDPYPCEAV